MTCLVDIFYSYNYIAIKDYFRTIHLTIYSISDFIYNLENIFSLEPFYEGFKSTSWKSVWVDMDIVDMVMMDMYMVDLDMVDMDMVDMDMVDVFFQIYISTLILNWAMSNEH